MANNLPILQSKLTIPNVSHTLARKRLIDPLKTLSHKKLALVIAGAGHGKTTLVAQTVKQLAADTIWYSLDHLDKDPAMFLGYLLTGIQNHYPDLGVHLWAKLSAPLASRKNREKLLLALLVEMEKKISNPLVITLDDYYRVQDSKEVAEILEFMLARIPSKVHIVIISRRDPGLKISRFRAMLEVFELTEKELTFRIDEVESLYRHLLLERMDPAQIRTLYAKTGGWTAALLLFFNAVKTKPTGASHDDLFDIGKSEKLIFTYLEENIFEALPKETRAFLMRSSLLEQLDPDFCDGVFGVKNARTILKGLAQNHLLTYPVDPKENRYQCHQLLRAFLKKRLVEEHGRKRVHGFHKDIAKAMETMGDLRCALDHFVRGAHFEEVVRILSGLMLLDFKNISISFLKKIIDAIPMEYIHNNARLFYIRAKVMSVSGQIRQAIIEFKTALELFEAEDSAAGASACLKDLGFHYYLTGDLERAMREMKALWAQPHEDPFFPVEVAGYLILFSAIMGDVDASESYYHEAVKKFTGSEYIDSHFIHAWFGLCRGYRFHVTGNFSEADKLNTKALDLFTKMQFEIFLPITYFQTALTTYFLSDPSKGCEYAQKGLNIARRLGIFDNQYAWLLYALALNQFGQGMVDQAMENAQEALDLFCAYDNAWGQALVYECRGKILGGQGKWDEAFEAFNTGMRVVGDLDLKRAPSQDALALGLARAWMETGRPGQARKTLEAHHAHIKISQFHLFQYYLLMAEIDAAASRMDDAVDLMDSALSLSKRNGYGSWIAPLRPWLLRLLVECIRLEKNEAYVKQLIMVPDRNIHAALNLLKTKTSGHLRRATEKLLNEMPTTVPAPLNIQCLGNFSVSIGDRPVPLRKWRSAKATLLFKYLVVKHDQGMIPTDRLLEFLWPDEDTTVTRPRLHVALNTLRKYLEADLVRGVPSAYIVRQNDAYRLAIGPQGRIDFKAFVQAVNNAADLDDSNPDIALDRYVQAASLYGGELLEEDPYEEWLTTERDMLKQTFLQILSKIIGLYENQASWHQCIDYAEIYLTQDPYAEPVYRSLMQFHSNTGNPAGAIEVFQKCKNRISVELDCQLSESTIKMHKDLTQKQT